MPSPIVVADWTLCDDCRPFNFPLCGDCVCVDRVAEKVRRAQAVFFSFSDFDCCQTASVRSSCSFETTLTVRADQSDYKAASDKIAADLRAKEVADKVCVHHLPDLGFF